MVGNSLSWSPDGRQIAFLGTFPSDSDWMVYVIDAQSGEITFSGPMDWETNAPANPGAPINSWGVTFPNWNTGLEACTAPPD
jgi:Tol biopolymer transport system component